MEPECTSFPDAARRALGDETLQSSLQRFTTTVRGLRRGAVERLPEFEALRDECARIRAHTLEHLDFYLEHLEQSVQRHGGHVHWCADREAARAEVLQICRAAGATSVTKGKSMISEELGLNAFLVDHGIEPIETDLGEYIIQLAGERPSHLLGPASHKTLVQVDELFRVHHRRRDPAGTQHTPEQLVGEARKVLRPKYFAAQVGITGANFLVAETGTAVIVTNEGNGDLTQILPKVHIVIASIEKVVPTLEDAATLVRMLSRSATGQEMTAYTTFATGPRRAEDPDGPSEFHLILYDGGRSRILGSPQRDVLRCIRCAACMNHCPIYRTVGGHAYGWVYPGPLGAALTPALLGVDTAHHLPEASTLCGTCDAVCPVKIPLRQMIRDLRADARAAGKSSVGERIAMRAAAVLARRPMLYRLSTRLLSRVLSVTARQPRLQRLVPPVSAWSVGRDLPAPQGRTFLERYHERATRP